MRQMYSSLIPGANHFDEPVKLIAESILISIVKKC
jgi:hypothetical protein